MWKQIQGRPCPAWGRGSSPSAAPAGPWSRNRWRSPCTLARSVPDAGSTFPFSSVICMSACLPALLYVCLHVYQRCTVRVCPHVYQLWRHGSTEQENTLSCKNLYTKFLTSWFCFNHHTISTITPNGTEEYEENIFIFSTVLRLTISTCQFYKLSDQSKSLFNICLVSFWLNVLSFPVSKGNERSSRFIRKTASVSLSAFQRQQDRRNPSSVGVMK